MSECITLVKGDYICVIPKGATNGEVIQALFPNIVIHKSSNGVLIVVENFDSQYPQAFYAEWWNAPYQKGGEE